MAEENARRSDYQKYTPEVFALYLIGVDPVLVLPMTTAEQIKARLPDLAMGVKRIERLREHPEFQATVRREFLDHIKDKDNLQKLFFVYLNHYVSMNLKSKNPSAKVIEVLGYMSDQYNPKKPETKEIILTPKQKAMMEHAKAQAEAAKKEKEGGS